MDKLSVLLITHRVQRPPSSSFAHHPLAPMFKIKVFNALQTRLGPAKSTSLKTTLQNITPNDNEDVTRSPQYIMLATRTNKRKE